MSETNNKAKEGLIEEPKALRQRVAELEESEDKCEQSEGGLQSDHQVLLDAQHDLRERIKELTCLYNITRLMAKLDISLDKVFNGVINIIKVAWQYPEITCARVLFGGKEFKTDNFRSTEWKQSSDIRVNGETAGALEVYYLEEKPEIDEGPFLKDERALIEDITKELGSFAERKQAEEKLRESENRYRDLYDNAPISYFSVGIDGLIKESNKAAELLLGYSVDELKDMKVTDLYAEESKPRARLLFNQFLGGIPIKNEEMVYLRKDRQKVYGLLSVSPIIDPYGCVVASRSVVRDISERKLMEQELREYQNHLEEQVEKRTTELVKTNKQLQVQMNKRIEFTRALVHELKTPLTPLLGASEAFANQLQEGPYLNLAKNIFIGASQLNRRIDELLDLARSEIGKLKVSCKPLDPLGLIHNVAEEMSPDAIKKGQSLVLEVPSSLPLVSADEDRLQQIIINLLDNAFKFTPGGGMITLKAMEKDGNLIIEVQDTGPGIAKDEQQRLFQPYYRMESDRERLSGLGLGLALCKNLVELHQGEIWIKSQKGRGSTFGFSIPLSSDSKLKRDMKKEVSNEDSNNRG